MNLSIEEYRKLLKEKKQSKYNNVKCEWTGIFRGRIQTIKFDSKKEMNRVCELMLDPTIRNSLTLQERFLLVEGTADEKPMHYVADAFYPDYEGIWTVEDIKGMRTEVYKMKKKLFKSRYPQIRFIES